MLDDDDRRALAQTFDQTGQAARTLRAHAGRRLVEKQQPRLGRQSDGNLQAPTIAICKAFGRQVLFTRKADVGEQLSGPCLQRRIATHLSDHAKCRLHDRPHGDDHVVERAVAIEQVHQLERARDAGARDRRRRCAGNVAAVEEHLPALGPVASGHDVEERCLAGTVRPDDSCQLACFNCKRDVVEHDLLPETLVQTMSFEQRHHAPWARVRLRS